MREESGQNPVFHAPPGGTKATARRPVRIVTTVISWCSRCGVLDGVIFKRVLICNRLGL